MWTFLVNHWFLLSMMLVAAVFVFVWLLVINKSLKMKWWEALLISSLSIFFGLAGAIIAHYFENGFDFKSIGTSIYGAIFIALLLGLLIKIIFKRFSYLTIMDNLAIAVSLFAVLTRFNCLKAGCCYGKYIGGDGGMRYPTREIDILVNLTFLIIASINILKKRYNGYHYFFFLMTYGLCRFVIEWFRHSETANVFHDGHIWSIIAVSVGLGSLLFVLKFERKGAKNEQA